MARTIALPARGPEVARRRAPSALRRYWLLYALLAPALLIFLVFSFIPTLLTVPLVFQEYYLMKGFFGSPFIGLGNLEAAWKSPDFFRVIENTIAISVLRLIVGFPVPIVLAILTHDLVSDRVKRLCQSITYVPHFLSWPIIYGVALAMLNPSDGVLIAFLRSLGLRPEDPFISETLFRPLLVGTGIWKEMGWGMIVYLAALAGVPTGHYESAIVDGAGWWQRIVYITLPGIKPVVALMLTLSLASILNAGFEQVYLFYNPLTYGVGDIIDTWVYRRGLITGDFGTATAVGFFKSVIALVLILVANKLARRYADQGIW